MTVIDPAALDPQLPAPLRPLGALAYDLRWTWSRPARALFARVAPELWREVSGNPVALMAEVGADRLEALAADQAFLASLAQVTDSLRAEAEASTWMAEAHPDVGSPRAPLVAYFSAEYGITEAMPIYSGGLGVLSGEHLKSAQDQGVPLVAVGLAYHAGYFRQQTGADGAQVEVPCRNDFTRLPVRLALGDDGRPITLTVAVGEREVTAQLWRAEVGRVSLYLLDTDCAPNGPAARRITSQLYGGGSELRIQQEIVLGMGGARALRALGLQPSVYHLNEGHSAFLILERLAELVGAGLDFAVALEQVAATSVFTTHTPVPAGFDVFTEAQMQTHLPRVHEALGLTREAFLALGAQPGDAGFNMALLALRTAGWINGVSQLHGQVSRGMWRRFWPGLRAEEVPIEGITNGIHVASWLGPSMARILDGHFPAGWGGRLTEPDLWRRVASLDDGAIWSARDEARAALVSFVRGRDRARDDRLGRPVDPAGPPLDPDALTIGFARRFATYKRATLLFRDEARLRRLLADPDRPVQLIFAGKAHPADTPGKALLAQLHRFVEDADLRRRVVFLEEYDIGVARQLVQGVDVWLNTPRRPKEASGTSGMKVLANGGLNLSILDGWWSEAYDGTNGWAIGDGESYDDPDAADGVEASLLLDRLEDDIIPLFYARNGSGVPEGWVARVKRSMGGLTAFFSTGRMVRDYTERLYLPAQAAGQALARDDHAGARALAARTARVMGAWDGLQVDDPSVTGDGRVEVRVWLGTLPPEDVEVEVVPSGGSPAPSVACDMRAAEGGGWFRYEADVDHDHGQTLTARLRPRLPRAAPARGLGARGARGGD